MRLTLSNGRTFIIKVRYRTEDKAKFSKDQYGRSISVTWQEHNTVVAIGEVLDHADMSTVYKVIKSRRGAEIVHCVIDKYRAENIIQRHWHIYLGHDKQD